MPILEGETLVAFTLVIFCFLPQLIGQGYSKLTTILACSVFMEQIQPVMSSQEDGSRTRPDIFDFISLVLTILLLHLVSTKLVLTIDAYTVSTGSESSDSSENDDEENAWAGAEKS